MLEPKLADNDIYQNLGYYLQVLYAVDYYQKVTALDFEREFPDNELQTLETDRCFIKFGRVNYWARAALTDLLEDGLVKLSIIDSSITTEPKNPALDQKLFQPYPILQGKAYWYIDEIGQKITLADKSILVEVSLTTSGKNFWKKLKKPKEKLYKEMLWEKAFTNSADQLAKLADEALAEIAETKTRKPHPEKV